MKNEDIIIRSYESYISLADKFIKEKKYNDAYSSLYYASSIMYAFQIKLNDERIERMLKVILQHIKRINVENINGNSDCILMYDSICNDKAALSMQYIRALELIGLTYHYVVLDKCYQQGKEVVEIVKRSQCGVLHVISNDLTYCDKANELLYIVRKVNPKKVLLHMANMDIVGASVWSLITGIERFYINHGDEQFWLGTNSLDYLLCFRGMGVNTAVKYRCIPASKCLIQPYYPIMSNTPFQGFDFNIPSGSVVLFSGGRFIKIYGEKNEFSNMIVEILQRNKNAFFIFAGVGNNKPFIEELKKKGVAERCKVIPYRKDLAELLKHVDIYLSTYPQSGGLMAQYAAAAAIPIVERDTMVGGVSEDLLPKLDHDIVITFQSLDEYYKKIDTLVSSREARVILGKEIKKGLLTEEEFTENLKMILFKHESKFVGNNRVSNVKLRSQRLINADNRYIHRFWGMLLNKYIVRTNLILFLKAIFMYIKYFGVSKVVSKIKNK